MEHGHSPKPVPVDAAEVVDPVCGMTVDPETAAGSTSYAGRPYHFCSQHCHQKFQADPQRYVRGERQQFSTETGTGSAIYTCPMHPEVRQDCPGTCPKCGMSLEPVGEPPPTTKVEYSCPMHPEVVSDHPGSCPKCGMALEPRTITAEEGPSPEYLDMRRRFWVGAALSLPVVVVAMSEMLPGKPLHFLDMKLLNWVQLALTTPVVLWCGWPFFERGWAPFCDKAGDVAAGHSPPRTPAGKG